MRRIDRRKILEGVIEVVMDLKNCGLFDKDWLSPRENEMITFLYFGRSIESISEEFGLSIEYTRILIRKACFRALKSYYFSLFRKNKQ